MIKEPQEQKIAAQKLLDDKLHRTLDVFTQMVAYMVEVAEFSKKDAANRSQRYLRTAEDLNVSTKLADNDWVKRIAANPSFIKRNETFQKREIINRDWVRRLYLEFVKTPEYLAYTTANFQKAADDKNIMKQLWAFIKADERFNDFISDEINGWEEDGTQVDMLMENLINNQHRVNFNVPLSKEKQEYATTLLSTVIDKEERSMELIKPKLQNWDPERVAQIDMILLKMAVCELLFYPTIPTKVTINEYIEIAKLYSTPQSGHFINGVVDNIQKELHQTGIINKQERYNKK